MKTTFNKSMDESPKKDEDDDRLCFVRVTNTVFVIRLRSMMPEEDGLVQSYLFLLCVALPVSYVQELHHRIHTQKIESIFFVLVTVLLSLRQFVMYQAREVNSLVIRVLGHC